MPFGLKQSKLVLTLVFFGGTAAGISAAPIWKEVLMAAAQTEYGELTYRCDHAMREHLIAKQTLVNRPSEENVSALKAAELGLLDCQEYDLMRKRLTTWGLSDNELSLMGLKAIEEKGSSIQEVVEIHEIRY